MGVEGTVETIKGIISGAGSGAEFFGLSVSEWIPIVIFIVVCLYFAHWIFLEYVNRTYISDVYE